MELYQTNANTTYITMLDKVGQTFKSLNLGLPHSVTDGSLCNSVPYSSEDCCSCDR